DLYIKGYWHDWNSTYLELHNVLGGNGQPTGALTRIYDGEHWAFEDRGINALTQFHVSKAVTLVAGYDFQSYSGMDDVFLIAPQSERVHAPFAQAKLDLDLLGGGSIAAGVRHNI